MRIAEIIAAGLLSFGGIRSLLHWYGRHFEATSFGEHFLYLMHVTARVGIWFSLAGFFLVYAFGEEPQRLRWFVLVPISLAGVQLLTGLLLGRSPSSSSPSEPSQKE